MGLLSMAGRYNRAKYFWIVFAIGMVTPIIGLGIGLAAGLSGGNPVVAGRIALIAGIGCAVVHALQVVKRLHDLGRPGTHYWLQCIPIYNIYFGLYILFKKGIDGENQYGPDPLASK